MNILKYITNPKYKYFIKKNRGVQFMIYDQEFKRFKALEIREEVRQDYDRMKARLETLDGMIAKESEAGGLKETNVDEFKRLEDNKVLLEKDIQERVNSMNDIDAEINGTKPSMENPNGSHGINQLLDSLRELQGLIKNYVKII